MFRFTYRIENINYNNQAMIKKLDFLGPKVTLRIRSNELFKSTIGGLATIITIIASVGTFFGFGLDIFRHANPRVTFNKKENHHPKYTLNHLTFLFAIYDQYTGKPYEELERKFTSTIQKMENDGEGNLDVQDYKLERCSPEAINKWKDAFFNQPSNYWCLPKNLTILLTGVVGEGASTMARLQVEYCKNTTTRSDCYSREFIEKNITGRIQMHYIVQSSQIDTINYTNPGVSIPFSGLTDTNTNTWNRLTFLFSNRHVETDMGFFISNIKDDLFEGVERVIPDSVYSIGTNSIFSHLFGNYRYEECYLRDYIKIQNVFALMGGFVNGARVVMSLIVKYLTSSDIVNIFNTIYKYKPAEKNGKIIDDKDNKRVEVTTKNVRSSNSNQLANELRKLEINIRNNNNKIENYKRFTNTDIPRKKSNENASSNMIMIENNNELGLNNNNTNVIDREKLAEICKTKNNFIYKFELSFCRRLHGKAFGNSYWRRQLDYREIIENKMNKIISIENLIELTRNIEYVNKFYIDKPEWNLFKACPIFGIEPKRRLSLSPYDFNEIAVVPQIAQGDDDHPIDDIMIDSFVQKFAEKYEKSTNDDTKNRLKKTYQELMKL